MPTSAATGRTSSSRRSPSREAFVDPDRRGGGRAIEEPPVAADDNVLPLHPPATGSRSHARERHPAGGAVPDASPGDELRDDGLPSERSIAAGLVEGRRWALAAAFERWSDLVHAVARQLVGRDHADDIVQQVYIEAWRSRQSFRPDRGEVPGWLVGITRNVARAFHRDRDAAAVPVDDHLDRDDTGPDPDAVLDGLLVASAFRDLPPSHREVLHLTLLEQYTQTAAAERLGIPLGTVKTRHLRGLAALRDALEGVIR